MNKTFITLEEPTRPAGDGRDFALWQLGFRPFYLLASVFAALSIPLWALQYAGWLGAAYRRLLTSGISPLANSEIRFAGSGWR